MAGPAPDRRRDHYSRDYRAFRLKKGLKKGRALKRPNGFLGENGFALVIRGKSTRVSAMGTLFSKRC